MCGITAIVSRQYKNLIQQSTACITHRGPDDVGVFEDEYLGFGQTRLAIQDLSANGHQPMFSADKRYCILLNGEIYNHWEIREPIKHKYAFVSTSDTETVLYGYLEYGTEIFNKLNGIFALSIYDTQTQDLIIVRDQFGVKPLYYYHEKGLLAFASEIKALSFLPTFEADLDYEALVNYLQFLWSPGEKTPFLKVKKLEAGHYIKLNSKIPHEFSTSKYYEIPFDGQYSTKTEAELIDELDEKLFSAVKRQLLSDVPVGFFLSGGLDSSAVVAMAKKAMPTQKLKCYTIDSGDLSKEGIVGDLEYAKLVAKHLDVDLEVVDGQMDILSHFDNMIYHLDEPQADIAPLHVLNICKKARSQGYVVLLGGTAGDDLFSGYRRHQALRVENILEKIPKSIRKQLKNATLQLDSTKSTFRRIRKVFAHAEKPQLERMAGYFSWLNLQTNKNLFRPEIQSIIAKYDPTHILIHSLKNIPLESNHLNQMLYWEMKYFLTEHNLNYTDKLSMAVGVEVRVPFLDKELVEFSCQLPPSLKLKGNVTKYLLKKVMERYLPLEVIYRPKSGFGAPVREWLLNDDVDVVNKYLSKEAVEAAGIFNYKAVHSLCLENKHGKTDVSYTILSLLAIQSWYNQFIKVQPQLKYEQSN
jgi:asparagine synthase (glutamine-hydrolysing)